MVADRWRSAATQLGLSIQEQPLIPGRWGEYHHHDRLILIRPGLTVVEERCTLAHEVAHAVHQDVLTGSRWHDKRLERRADVCAAAWILGNTPDPDLVTKQLLGVWWEEFRHTEPPFSVCGEPTRWYLRLPEQIVGVVGLAG